MPQIRMNSLKSLAMNCGPLSEMIRGRASGYRSRARWMIVSTSASVMRLADLPVDDEPAAAVEQAAEVEERPGNVDVRDVDVPVLMGPQRLLEALSLERRLAVVRLHQAGIAEHAVFLHFRLKQNTHTRGRRTWGSSGK